MQSMKTPRSDTPQTDPEPGRPGARGPLPVPHAQRGSRSAIIFGAVAALLAVPSFTRVAGAERNVAGAERGPSSLPCPPKVPEALNPPADATLELAWPASGVQIYACTQPKPSEAPSWTLEGPHAVLTSGKAVAAIHFAGPTWQGLDGSQVKGARGAVADAPVATAVPWLSMSGSASGAGTFAHTTFIQRLDTAGGKAPASGCDAAHLGAKVLVPYQANYFFYRQASGAETVRQCRSRAEKRDAAAKPGASANP
jgi:hypothetical protein